jgi:photosystem II stability/assembly factor-like uncharacterized protein
MKIKGKQIDDSTLIQSNLNITTDSITHLSAVTNVLYLQQEVDYKIGDINFAVLNNDMPALNTLISGDLACNKHIIEYPISNVRVKVNGIEVNVGGKNYPYDCYFSGDSGVTARSIGQEIKGDYLYWNNSNYNLDTNDEIDFNYIVNYKYYNLLSGSTTTFNDKYNNMVVEYTGDPSSTSTVIIDSVSFTVGNVGGSFVFDIGGSFEHTFTYILETITIDVNGNDYDIVWDGFGSLIFSVAKKKTKPTKKLLMLVGDNIISTTINKMLSYDENNNYILTDIQNETYSDEFYKFSSNNWSKINTPKGYNEEYHYYDVTFNGSSIFMSAYYRTNEQDNTLSKIIKSTNGGNTWDVVYTSPSNYNGYIPQIIFLNSLIGFVVIRTTSINYGHNFGLLKTTDGGNTWNMINPSFAFGNHYQLTFTDENNLWFYGTHLEIVNSTFVNTQRIFYSSNGGVSSTNIYIDTIQNMRNLQFINSTIGYYLNFNTQTLFNTINGGVSFTNMNTDFGITGFTYLRLGGFKILNDKFFVANTLTTENNDNQAYLCISQDSGQTWVNKYIYEDFYIDGMNVINDNTILVYGKFQGFYYMPVVFKTTDGGDNWLQILNKDLKENFINYRSIHFIDNNNGWLLGESEMLLKTENGGLDWIIYDIGLTGTTSYTLNQVYFKNNSTGYIIGYYYANDMTPMLLKTSDDGITWEQQNLPEIYASLDKILFNGNDGWIFGYDIDYNTILFYSSDNGETWVNKEFTLPNSYINDMIFINSSTGFIIGSDNSGNYENGYSFVYKTTDGGDTWILDENLSIEGISYYKMQTNGSSLFLSASDNSGSLCYLYKSNDNGQTWNSIPLILDDETGWIQDIEFTDVNNGSFLFSYGGVRYSQIYTTSDGGNTWKKIETSTMRGDYNDISKNYIVGYSYRKTIVLAKIS